MESRKEAFHRYNQLNQIVRAIIIGILTGLVVSLFRLIIQCFLQLVTTCFGYFHSHPLVNTVDDWINHLSVIIRVAGSDLSRYKRIRNSAG